MKNYYYYYFYSTVFEEFVQHNNHMENRNRAIEKNEMI
jgi:hypothetical protein